MNRNISPERSLEIIADLAEASLDIRGLMLKYGVDREDLARWMLTEKTQRILAGLCILTDYQTQLMLSHYRVTAVTRLVEMAQRPKERFDIDGIRLREADQPKPLDPDLVRKACVDLLRLNMGTIESTPTPAQAKPVRNMVDVVRELIYKEKAAGAAENAAADTEEPTASKPDENAAD